MQRYVNSLNYGKDVVVVTNKSSKAKENKAFLGSFFEYSWPNQGLWTCASPEIGSGQVTGGCTSEYLKRFSNEWTVVYKGPPWYEPNDNREPVAALYCLSAGAYTKDGGCGLHFGVPILVSVCVLNLIKCVCISWIAYCDGFNESLQTTGDAIALYLREPDSHTDGMPLATRDDFPQGRPWTPRPRERRRQSLRWYQAASWRRWTLVLIL